MSDLTLHGTTFKCDANNMFCANDVMKVYGLGRDRRPEKWTRTGQAQRFLADQAGRQKGSDMGLSEKGSIPGVIETRRGRRGGTYMNQQVLLAWLSWVSPEIQREVQDVFIRHQRGDPSLAESTLDKAAQKQARGETPTQEESWSTRRTSVKAQRNLLTGVLKEHGVSRRGYGQITNALYKGAFGTTAPAMRKVRALPANTQEGPHTRDFMTEEELAKTQIGETLLPLAIQKKDLSGDTLISEEAYRAGEEAAKYVDGFLDDPEVSGGRNQA